MRRAGAVLAIVAALAIAACGGSRTSLDGLRAAATRICLQAGAQTDRIPPPRVPADTADFLRLGVAELTPELARLRALRPPAGDAGDYSAALSAFARELGILRTTSAGLDRGDDPVSTIKTLQKRLAPVESDEDAAWRELQVPACLSR